MIETYLVIVIFSLVKIIVSQETTTVNTEYGHKWSFVGTPQARAEPCKGNKLVIAIFEAGLAPEDQNMYTLSINQQLPRLSRVQITFDSEALITVVSNKSATLRQGVSKLNVVVYFFKESKNLYLKVKGPATGTVPYPTSIVVNNEEYCKDPSPGFLDSQIEGYKSNIHLGLSIPDSSCGRRKVQHTELIVNGQPTKPGDWPWHAAIYRLEESAIRYICGGTLISKNFVLTAAHCTTINGIVVFPEILSVVLGKYNLIGGDLAAQERRVLDVIVHEEYYHKTLDNDIALLKLKTEAVFDDYVQPACLFRGESFKKLPPGITYGTVVGWGFNHMNQLSSELHQVVLPTISDSTCIKSNPDFYGKLLNVRKFCAGYRNGTSACNGDSGGGYMVFVPDVSTDTSPNATGSYHALGVVSLALRRRDLAVCDDTQYSIFTSVRAFVHWIENHIKIL